MLSFYFETRAVRVCLIHAAVWLLGAVSNALMFDLRDLRLLCWQRASLSAPLGAARESKPANLNST